MRKTAYGIAEAIPFLSCPTMFSYREAPLAFRSLFVFRRDEFQQVSYFTLQNGADPGQDIDIQTGDLVVAVVVQLCALEFRPLAELVFADAAFLDQRVEPDFHRSEFFHRHPLDSERDT